MIDVKFYANKNLGENAPLWLKYFSKKEYKSLYAFANDMKNVDVSWINNSETQAKLRTLCSTFANSLENEQLKFQEVIEKIEDKIDILSHTEFAELNFSEGRYSSGTCPSCNKKELYIPKHGKTMTLVCNRKNACGYSSSAYTYLKDYRGKSSKEALEVLAESAGTSLEAINAQHEVHTDKVVFEHKPIIRKTPIQKLEDKKIDYVVFDDTKESKVVDNNNFLPTQKIYSKLDEIQKFKVFATTIYEFSKTTKQWGKEKYYKSIGISKDIPVLKEKYELVHNVLGYLHFSDIEPLKEHLLKCGFTDEDLSKYGLFIGDKFFASIVEGLVVIPNFDLYTNMVTGLKFRKTKLRTWIDADGVEQKDKNKEPELSYKRIANPLPYLLTRDALANKAFRFRFFEGQKDLHAMPLKPFCCDIAIPGINGISEELLGLFKGRIVELWFDQDEAGQEGARKLKEKLEMAGAIVIIKTWNISFGKDVNEVLNNGKIYNLI
jgi:DNA primase